MERSCVYCKTTTAPLMQTTAWQCSDGIDCYGRQEAVREPGEMTGVQPEDTTAVELTGREIRTLCVALRGTVRLVGGRAGTEGLARILAVHDKLSPLEPCQIVEDDDPEAEPQMDDILAMHGIG
jgi:hypothetical protein